MNLKIRLKSKTFWLTLIPAILLLAQTIAVPFGYKFNFENLGSQLTEIVNAIFGVLTILGIATDPTTAGFSDTKNVMKYNQPRKDDK